MPVATDQTDKVTTSVAKNIKLNVYDNDGDDVEVKITDFPTKGQIGGVIYNSTHTTYEAYFKTGTEFGDEIDLGAGGRRVSEFAFEAYSELSNVANGTTPTATLKIYANDGATYGGVDTQKTGGANYGAKMPGTLLYKSDAQALVAGFHTYRVTDINVDLPAKVTWTVEFDGVDNDTVGSGKTAALILAGTDDVGSSLDDFWQKDASGWKLYRQGTTVQDNDFTANVVSYDKDSLIVKYTPASGYTGSDSFTYEVIDGNGGSDTATVTIAVADNNVPVATDQTDKVTTSVAKNIKLNVYDNDGDDVEVKITDFPTKGQIGGVIYNSTHTTYEAYFKTGTEFGDEIDLGAGGRRVSEFAFEAYSELSNVASGTTPTATLKIYANDGATYGGVDTQKTGGADYGAKMPGTLLYKSDAQALVAGFHTYRVTDINVDLPAKVTWTVEFDGVDNDTVGSGKTAALILAGTDDVGSSLDDFWQKDASGWKLYRQGTTVQDNDFTANVVSYDKDSLIVKYTPASGYTGSDSFTYEVIDGNGGSDTATVTIAVADNNVPVAADQTDKVTTSVAKNIKLNVYDNDGDDVEVKITDFPTKGQIGGVIYNSTHTTYEAYFKTGTEFGDEIDLGSGGRRVSEFAFEAYSELSNVANGTTPTATLKIYANDGATYGGVDTQKTGGANYGAKMPGTLLYKSDAKALVAGFHTYRVTDINVDLPAKVTWTVEFDGVDNDTVGSGKTAALILAGNDDVGSSLDDFWQKDASGWKLYRQGTTVQDNDFTANVVSYDKDSLIVKYTPASGYTGSDSFTYEVIDGNGGDTATVTIAVADNNVPVAADQTDKVTTSVAKNIKLNVYDNDGDDVEVKITDFPTKGQIGGVIYNSTHTTYEAYFKTGTEFGDEIDLGAGGRRVSEFAFEAYSELSNVARGQRLQRR